eukprot:3043130-Rhodomonas_salina.3
MGMAAAGGKVYLFGGLVQNGGMWNGDGGIVHRSESEMCMWGCLHVANVEQRLFETYDEDWPDRSNDLHTFDPESRSWTDLSSLTTGPTPQARQELGMVSCQGKLYVFGGWSGQGEQLMPCNRMPAGGNRGRGVREGNSQKGVEVCQREVRREHKAPNDA